ncbi:MAG: T9SS type A sorting domain-containing protein, partial [Bacteroidales bacterium]|nr:T9SS type A sorting domain-containing protein [Bacteroidales bacterium]
GINASLWSDWTVRCIFSTNPAGVRGVDDVAFSLFPNPATDAFTVETVAIDSRLTLFDIRGTELYSVDIRSTSTTIGIADLPSGVYFVSLTSLAGTTTKRLAVDRH